MSVYVGIDVHRKRSQVSVLQADGQQRLNRNLVNGSADLAQLLGSLPAGTPVAFEAAYGWSWLLELLDDLELEPHLAHASRCKAIASARLKDDRVDSRTLAQLLRADLLPQAWIAPAEVRGLRALLRHRAALVRLRTMAKNRTHALLADAGLDRGEGAVWSAPGRAWLAEAPLSPAARLVVEDYLALIDHLADPIAAVEAQITARAKPDPRVKILMALPGVGKLTAMTVLAEIGDITRFPTARKLCAWAGLTPTVHNSDRKVRHGHITKQGSVWVRWILAEAAQRAKRDPAFAATYAAIAHRRGRGIATVAIARKLLGRAFHLLTEHAKTTTGGAFIDDGAGTRPAITTTPTNKTTTTNKTQPTTRRMVTSTGCARRTA
jgi:transposase